MTSVLDLELQRLRTMTASEKVAVMQSLWRQAWSLKLAGVRAQHPDWTPVQVRGMNTVFIIQEINIDVNIPNYYKNVEHVKISKIISKKLDLPNHMQKYVINRYNLFSKFDEGI